MASCSVTKLGKVKQNVSALPIYTSKFTHKNEKNNLWLPLSVYRAKWVQIFKQQKTNTSVSSCIRKTVWERIAQVDTPWFIMS